MKEEVRASGILMCLINESLKLAMTENRMGIVVLMLNLENVTAEQVRCAWQSRTQSVFYGHLK